MRFMMFVAGLALSLPSVAAAQAQQEQAKPQQEQAKASSDDKTITVVGCLQSGAQPNQFVLASTPDQLAKGVAVATSGTVPNVTYQLSGGSNLAAHLGHRVEVTGTSSGKSQKAAATESSVRRTESPSGPDTKVETTEKAAIELRDLRIQSLKMVSTDCKAR
jgi:hypothetical protein